MGRLFVSNKDESARMFKSDFLESLSKVRWTTPLIIFVPIILFFLVFAVVEYSILAAELVGLYIAGVAMWTLAEYTLHRFVFHYHPKSERLQKIFWTFHGVHHDYPQDSMRLVMPPSVSLPLAAIFFALFYAIFGAKYVGPVFAGFLSGYLFYDITHYAIHHFAFKNKFWLSIKKHHMTHHYKHPELGFGVSSPFWDYVFRTTYPEKK